MRRENIIENSPFLYSMKILFVKCIFQVHQYNYLVIMLKKRKETFSQATHLRI